MSSNRRPEEDSNNNVDDQVKKLLKDGIRGKIPTSIINDIRRKYNDDALADKIQEAFYERLNEIKTRARKFAKLIEKKFGTRGLPLHIVLKESKKYKDKYSLTDTEFDEFKIQYEKLLNSRLPQREQAELVPSTNMAQLFGDLYSSDGIIIKDSDYPVVQDIIKMYTMTRMNHSSVILQSMQYEDCALEVINGKFDPQRHNTACAIHPLIAAMFIPKIQMFDEHFLYTNIAYIVKAKYNKEPINNQSDVKLLYHMVNDANDVVCSADTPLKDLRLRANLQNNLWTNVIALRNGKFFDCAGNDFFAAIDDCKISMYDAPDLLYVGDEGVILKRLIGAFSFRPIVVSTNPVFGTFGTANPINFPVISNRVVATSLLTLRLPRINTDNTALSLDLAISQTQVYIENGMFVPKTQEIVYINGVVIFHVPRRTLNTDQQYEGLIKPQIQWEQIPAHILQNERINGTPIDVRETMTIAKIPYYLRSAVFLNLDSTEKIVISTTALIRKAVNNILADTYLVYNSQLAGSETGGAIDLIEVMTTVDAMSVLRTQTTIFIYAKDYNK